MQVHCHVIHEGTLILKDVPANATVNSLRNLLKQQSITCKQAPVINLILSGTVLADQPLSSLNISPPHYIVVHTAEGPLQSSVAPVQEPTPTRPPELRSRWPTEDEIALVQKVTNKQRERCIAALVIANHDPNAAVNLMYGQCPSSLDSGWLQANRWVIAAMRGTLHDGPARTPTEKFFQDMMRRELSEKYDALAREFSGSEIVGNRDVIMSVLAMRGLDENAARKELKEMLGQ